VTSFRDLHYGDLPLVLANAWDVPSALMLLEAGFTAIATTSCGVSVSHGVPDGAASTKDANLALATALHHLDCHVSIDIEDGYSADPDEVAAYVAGLPADGINIEDSTAGALIDPVTYAAKVHAIKARSPEIFVNARIDTYWFNQDANLTATVARAERYIEAGADGIFVPGVSDAELLRSLAGAIDRPLNVLAISGSSPADLGALGVRRISTGSLPFRAAMTAAVAAAVATRDGQTFPGAVSYPDLQNLLIRYTEGR
jgi:2-methylisocitrate lyase-like PEP mutase family enzyme